MFFNELLPLNFILVLLVLFPIYGAIVTFKSKPCIIFDKKQFTIKNSKSKGIKIRYNDIDNIKEGNIFNTLGGPLIGLIFSGMMYFGGGLLNISLKSDHKPYIIQKIPFRDKWDGIKKELEDKTKKKIIRKNNILKYD